MPGSSEDAAEAAITLTGDLHARPAGSIAVAAARFQATVELAAGDTSVNAKSVLAVMALGATAGQRVVVRGTGPDAPAAVAALIEVLAAATLVGG
jgi:phosphotransferase system HPr (HPr) family protein